MDMCCQLSLEYFDIDKANNSVDKNVQSLSCCSECQNRYWDAKRNIKDISYFAVSVL